MPMVRIYQPSKSPLQGGRAGTGQWRVTFEPSLAPQINPLTGWVSSTDMTQEIWLSFQSFEQALAFIKTHGLTYTLMAPCKTRSNKSSLR